MKALVKTIALAATMAMPLVANAQDKVETEIGADLVSNYIWRGQDLGGAAIQPSIGVSYKGLSLTAWGSYGLLDKDGTKEIDLTLAYTTGGLTVGLTDYYCMMGGVATCPGKYFHYDSHDTDHVFEVNLGYDFGCFSVNWFTNVAGLDAYDVDGKRVYTSYFELAAPFKLGGLDWEAQLGAIPYSAGTGYYDDVHAQDFAVTNITLKTSKEIDITPTFKLPLFGALTANPSTQSLYFTAGVTF